MNYYDTSIQMCGQYCILAPCMSHVNMVTRMQSLSVTW